MTVRACPLEENIANTRRVVAAAHAAGVGVEAELGHVGMGDQYDSEGRRGIGFTDPANVERFVEQTGVDFLAIAFGTAHGFYNGEPHLDLDLLSEIRRRVDVPLVMHGGTGLSDEQFRAAIAAGINKINFATSIMNSAADNMRWRPPNRKPVCSIFTLVFAPLIHIGAGICTKPLALPDGPSREKRSVRMVACILDCQVDKDG